MKLALDKLPGRYLFRAMVTLMRFVSNLKQDAFRCNACSFRDRDAENVYKMGALGGVKKDAGTLAALHNWCPIDLNVTTGKNSIQHNRRVIYEPSRRVPNGSREID